MNETIFDEASIFINRTVPRMGASGIQGQNNTCFLDCLGEWL